MRIVRDGRLGFASAAALGLLLLCFSIGAAAETVLTLKSDFISKYMNRATIDAAYTIDKAHAKPNAPSKDADIHVAGRAPGDIGLATVAEMMNAAERRDALQIIHDAEGSGRSISVSGAWRIWAEHGGEQEHIQGKKLDPFDTTNPPHVFEIHPISKIGGLDVRDTFHPIEGYEPKDAERAFTQYERTRSKITVLGAGRVKISMPMAGMNYVK